jgi:uncharacterized protein YdaU (DUF1376 family)
MATINEMPLQTDAYLADTGHLSTFEHGAYFLILMAMWRSPDGTVADDDVYLSRAARTTLDRWKRIATNIRALLTVKGDRITQKRLQSERRKVESQNTGQLTGQLTGRPAKPLKHKEAGSNTAPQDENAPLILTLVSTDSVDSKVRKKGRKGEVLPEDWRPSDRERLYGRSIGLTEIQIDRAAEKMRRWALANSDRAVARKTRWDLTFRNWLDGDVERSTKNGGQHERNCETRTDHPNRSPPSGPDIILAGMGRVAARYAGTGDAAGPERKVAAGLCAPGHGDADRD